MMSNASRLTRLSIFHLILFMMSFVDSFFSTRNTGTFSPSEMIVATLTWEFSFTIRSTQLVLLAVWSALIGGSFDRRFAMITLLLTTPVWLGDWTRFLDNLNWNIFVSPLIVFFVFIRLSKVRWQALWYDTPDTLPDDIPMRYNLRDMLVAMIVFAVILALVRMTTTSGRWAYYLFVSPMLDVALAVLCAWACLGRNRPHIPAIIFAGAVLMIEMLSGLVGVASQDRMNTALISPYENFSYEHILSDSSYERIGLGLISAGLRSLIRIVIALGTLLTLRECGLRLMPLAEKSPSDQPGVSAATA